MVSVQRKNRRETYNSEIHFTSHPPSPDTRKNPFAYVVFAKMAFADWHLHLDFFLKIWSNKHKFRNFNQVEKSQ
jgi:hypothetical protein